MVVGYNLIASMFLTFEIVITSENRITKLAYREECYCFLLNLLTLKFSDMIISIRNVVTFIITIS